MFFQHEMLQAGDDPGLRTFDCCGIDGPDMSARGRMNNRSARNYRSVRATSQARAACCQDKKSQPPTEAPTEPAR